MSNHMEREPSWCMQVEVHAHYRNEHVRDWAKKNGVHVTAYSPLSSPALVKDMGMDFPELMQVYCIPFLGFKVLPAPTYLYVHASHVGHESNAGAF